jgi:hypothetical protein
MKNLIDRVQATLHKDKEQMTTQECVVMIAVIFLVIILSDIFAH